uniref:ORF3 protein n=1 Tax=Bat Coronavirus PaGD18 TaxID=3018869 RepID=A0AA49ED65_9NIDO|nr:ORF3 protein [Bat Coronavirus PaGD18]
MMSMRSRRSMFIEHFNELMMRVQRPPTLLLILLVANAFSKPIGTPTPEHCSTLVGREFQSCIRQAQFDTAGMYTNRVIVLDRARTHRYTIDRDTTTAHDTSYDTSDPQQLSDIGYSFDYGK